MTFAHAIAQSPVLLQRLWEKLSAMGCRQPAVYGVDDDNEYIGRFTWSTAAGYMEVEDNGFSLQWFATLRGAGQDHYDGGMLDLDDAENTLGRWLRSMGALP